MNIANSHFSQGSGTLQPPNPGLMRSKSDHRLATQFRQQEERGYEDEPALGGRKFGERPKERHVEKTDRYGRGTTDYGDDYDNDTRPSRSRYSRFRRHQENDSDTEQNSRGVRFSEQQKAEREKVLDTEDVARGPLSGITRLADSPRVMKKLQENVDGKKKEKESAPVVAPAPPKVVPKRPPPPANRQVSEEDEIAKIKKQNKGATTSTETEAERPAQRKTPAPEVSLDEP